MSKHLRIGMGLSLGVAIICLTVAIYFYWRSRAIIIEEYNTALSLPYTMDSAWKGRAWGYVVPLDGSLSAEIKGREGPTDLVVLFCDEISPRIIVHRTDYIFPVDVRLSRDNRILFVKVAGLGGGIVREAFIYKYDLHRRELVGRVPTKY